MTYPEQLARMRVAMATGHIPPDLAAWVLEELVERAAIEERIEARDTLIRAAAALLPGSTWARARQIRAELDALTRSHGALAGARALLAEAEKLYPCPASPRQISRILDM